MQQITWTRSFKILLNAAGTISWMKVMEIWPLCLYTQLAPKNEDQTKTGRFLTPGESGKCHTADDLGAGDDDHGAEHDNDDVGT